MCAAEMRRSSALRRADVEWRDALLTKLAGVPAVSNVDAVAHGATTRFAGTGALLES